METPAVKMTIKLTVDVDPKQWAAEYGDEVHDRRAYQGEIREALEQFAVEATRSAVRHLPVAVNVGGTK